MTVATPEKTKTIKTEKVKNIDIDVATGTAKPKRAHPLKEFTFSTKESCVLQFENPAVLGLNGDTLTLDPPGKSCTLAVDEGETTYQVFSIDEWSRNKGEQGKNVKFASVGPVKFSSVGPNEIVVP